MGQRQLLPKPLEWHHLQPARPHAQQGRDPLPPGKRRAFCCSGAVAAAAAAPLRLQLDRQEALAVRLQVLLLPCMLLPLPLPQQPAPSCHCCQGHQRRKDGNKRQWAARGLARFCLEAGRWSRRFVFGMM